MGVEDRGFKPKSRSFEVDLRKTEVGFITKGSRGVNLEFLGIFWVFGQFSAVVNDGGATVNGGRLPDSGFICSFR